MLKIYLISDSTGETVCAVARASLAQFDGVSFEEKVYPFIRTEGQINKVVEEIEKEPGLVLCTIVDGEIRSILKDCCVRMSVPYIPVLARVIGDLQAYLNIQATPQPGKQHEVNEDYFSRIEAIDYSLNHDDGQKPQNLDEADIILVGPSRTSKSPTCVYLAYRGLKTANVPYVPNCPLPESLFTVNGPLVVGLMINPERLIEIRRSRISSSRLTIKSDREDIMEETDYTNYEKVKEELQEARRLYSKNNWPVIDVTRKSVEEIATTIIQLFNKKHNNKFHYIAKIANE